MVLRGYREECQVHTLSCRFVSIYPEEAPITGLLAWTILDSGIAATQQHQYPGSFTWISQDSAKRL